MSFSTLFEGTRLITIILFPVSGLFWVAARPGAQQHLLRISFSPNTCVYLLCKSFGGQDLIERTSDSLFLCSDLFSASSNLALE